LVAIVDYNHYADHGDVNQLMRLEPFEQRFTSFGWETAYLEHGNDVTSVTNALRAFGGGSRPKMLIANTVKNFGVPLWSDAHLHQAAGDTLSRGIAQGRALLAERVSA
jgi:transketolase